MNYSVSAADLSALRFNEQDTVSSVLQNIAMILATPKGSVPLYRDFGLDWRYLDRPSNVMRVLMIPVIREAVERWEPRATVRAVSYSDDPNQPGVLIPRVEVEISVE